ncbi:MAG: M1 family aminopeptidase [Chitinophagaceae bacterium]
MKKNKCSILAFLFILLFTGIKVTSAQTNLDSSLKKIATLEKNAFQKLLINNGPSNDLRFEGTTASNNFNVNFYRCEWELNPNIRFIKGKVTSYFTISATTNNIVFDLSDTLKVDSITYHGSQIAYERAGNDALKVLFPINLNTTQKDSVSIYYNGVPRITNTYRAFVQTTHNGTPVIWTLSEPFGAKEWWPCKNGLDDKADSIDIIITSPSIYNATSNGIKKSVSYSDSTQTVYFSHRYPIASYLVAAAVTNYITTTDSVKSGTKTIPLIANAFPENVNDFVSVIYYAKQSIAKFSELFGEYPFSKEHYAQTQFAGGGGMEHQTNTFIGTTWNQAVAHELGHQWFGDHVTCGSWQHIWLNEGFANYMQFIYVQNFDTTIISAHLSYYLNLITSLPSGSVFVPDSSSPSRIFDSRLTYAKGGYVLHMLRGLLGDSLFFKGLRQYLNDPIVSGSFAKTEDLERNLEQISGKNLHSFFQKWIYGEGYANYNCTWTQNKNNWAKVQINQSTSDPSVSFYEMPIQLEFRNSSRDTIITVNNQQNGETFWVNLGFAADTMLLDPKLWILAKDRTVRKISPSSNIKNDILVYPNPAFAKINIQVQNPTAAQISVDIYNIAGQLLYRSAKKTSGSDELIGVPVQSFSSGMYIVKVWADTSLLTTKKIIVR